jgi:predicted MFS family arabinose efflux permease
MSVRERAHAGGLVPSSADARRIFGVQALRAFAYGLGSVLVGVTLARRGLSGAAVGGVVAALLAGIALASVLIARYGDRIGRRRTYSILLVLMAASGTVFALTDWLPALLLAALTGTVSTDVVESGPFTSLEQAMLPRTAGGTPPARLFASYNTVATLTGSLGALAAAASNSSAHWLLAYPIAAGLALPVAMRLSPAVEEPTVPKVRGQLNRSRPVVRQLAALFALDSFGGGFVPQTFIAYLLVRKFHASAETIGVLFFGIGLLQAISFQLAGRLAGRIGLVRTMVFSHLPSNVLLACVAFAPNLTVAIVLLLARHLLSQMDVPVRQALVITVVEPEERTAAAGYTNATRYVARPIGSLLAGAVSGGSLGAPFAIAGAIKSVYDLAFYALFRRRLP